jgi:hypothetical protein
MKTLKYSILSILVLVAFSVQAQKKYDKKVKETFKVNSDVEIVINTNYTDVDIQTWNRNEVSVEAIIEVEGVDEKEATKLLEQWNFEALGNSSKVKINSFSNKYFFRNDHNFNYDFRFPDIEFEHFEMPEMPELPELPEIEFPEFFMPEIEIPEIEIEAFEFDYDKYKNDSTYMKEYKKQIEKAMKKFNKGDWKVKIEEYRNSDEYKNAMKEYKVKMKAWSKKFKESDYNKKLQEKLNSQEFKKSIEEVKKKAELHKKEMLENKEFFQEQAKLAKEETLKVKEMIAKMKEEGKFDSIHNHSENIFFFSDKTKNSKVKIKKYIKIKVPKKATFDLNVRHGKLNVPRSSIKMSANIEYGDFIGGVLEGNDNILNIANSPVVIDIVNSGNITLRNVPNATFGTFSNANLFANSSDVLIDELGKNVALSQRFGTLKVINVMPQFENLNLVVDYAKATIDLSNATYVYQVNNKKSKVNFKPAIVVLDKKANSSLNTIKGYSKDKNSNNKLQLTAVYSTVNIE